MTKSEYDLQKPANVLCEDCNFKIPVMKMKAISFPEAERKITNTAKEN
jgi:DNA-directed RNA polymerase subunit RPC12/RpoP